MITKLKILLIMCFAAAAISAQDDVKVPGDVKPFVGKDTIPVAVETADLNGDGRKDYILVLENSGKKTADDLDDPRSLLILTREADGKLKLAKQNDKVVYCRQCGGVFGDPFAGIRIKPNSFTVDNYGGSNWRWGDSYTFNYSRIDRTWQLVRVERETFNALNPKDTKTKIRTPKNFGKVDIADFDPDKIK
ncbi:MAG TPA: hypothetical protein VHQ01_13060 [Pyrinomonadaceae bacterium]|nr:hypothetical protein [Pyrinomonadaceae bacterium]